jgi:probable F420-dependent oxidoreductase
MRFSYCPAGSTIAEFAAAAAAAEHAGYDRVWANELHRNPFVQLAAAAGVTARIGLATGIALAFVRSPLTTALAALDLDELSDGRFSLGLGSGVARLNEDWHHARFGQPVPHLRETVALVRQFMATADLGEAITFEGEYERARVRGFRRPYPPVRRDLPVYLAAVGPAMTRLAGEIADGWIAHELCSPQFLRTAALPGLAAGLRRAGRVREEITVVASACCVVDDDPRQAKRVAARHVAFYASVKTYEPFFALHGFAAEAAEIRAAFRDGDLAGMAMACPDDMVDAFTFAGSADDVRAALHAYDGLADEVKLSMPAFLAGEEAARATQRVLLDLLG